MVTASLAAAIHKVEPVVFDSPNSSGNTFHSEDEQGRPAAVAVGLRLASTFD